MRVVVLVSADGEWQAVKSLLQDLEVHQTALGESFEVTLEARPLIFQTKLEPSTFQA